METAAFVVDSLPWNLLTFCRTSQHFPNWTQPFYNSSGLLWQPFCSETHYLFSKFLNSLQSQQVWEPLQFFSKNQCKYRTVIQKGRITMPAMVSFHLNYEEKLRKSLFCFCFATLLVFFKYFIDILQHHPRGLRWVTISPDQVYRLQCS